MNDEILEKYLEAGKIASATLKESGREIRIGRSYPGFVESVEARVRDRGADLAFPLNVSCNEDAAHDTASPGDERVFCSGDVIKLDLGVQVDGYIADTAMTIDLGNNGLLLEASREALEAAIRAVRPGVPTGAIGAIVENEITCRGFRPVANLTGHGLDRYSHHHVPAIPGIATTGGSVLAEGMVLAIEPFATTGTGRVGDKTRTEIYSRISEKPVRLPSARAVMERIRDRRGLPFSRRWMHDKKMEFALPGLVRSGILHGYPVLADVPGSRVSQHEHTMIVTADGCRVTTR